MAILTCEDLSFSYEGRTVLHDVNFHVDTGDYLCIVGENGSGKSTLIKGLLGLQQPKSGKIKLNGVTGSGIGYLPQHIFEHHGFKLDAVQTVLMGCCSKCQKAAQQ